ncbi:Alpha/beta hydrolase family protein [Corynebacterium kalinowskii]|uniref:Alpha/beta hydrolase family protein n=1 Tax=Corynebacterium kalinowskii TaxID=2675216 RepID=A0A6B8VV76_9CORY|nr:dienelactone hydrolase family protein [Corynebacterium kalinowskii]QGU02825.1 Alpha/beta hydrolase family protein [Corynebacterium kalinowskii]
MAENLNKHLSKLSKRGPHRVLVGDLEYAGLPGKIYTPAEGNGLPAVAFGHDWMTDIKRYHATVRHLASWGIVVAAPNTETGFLPNHRGFAADLETAIQILTGVKLGTGSVTVAPGKIGLVGHGMGAGCAVLAAAGREHLKAVAALYPALTSPSCETAAQAVTTPGFVLGESERDFVNTGNPVKVAANWAGACAYREIDGATQAGFAELSLSRVAMGMGRPQTAIQELTRGLLTGFLLHRVDGQNKYEAFSDSTATARKVTSFDATGVRLRLGDVEHTAL